MKRKILCSLIMLMVLLAVGQSSYAVIEIVASKDNTGTDSVVSVTVSESYELCQQMTAPGGTLYGADVTSHLATNKDWGAVAYLSISQYGTNTEGGTNGVLVSIDGVSYYSTTDNISGVMNWGSNPNVTRFTHTAGLMSSYVDSATEPTIKVAALYANKDTKYVDIFGNTEDTTKGMALVEMGIGIRWDASFPVVIRTGLFSANAGGYGYGTPNTSGSACDGKAQINVTFRPVVRN